MTSLRKTLVAPLSIHLATHSHAALHPLALVLVARPCRGPSCAMRRGSGAAFSLAHPPSTPSVV